MPYTTPCITGCTPAEWMAVGGGKLVCSTTPRFRPWRETTSCHHRCGMSTASPGPALAARVALARCARSRVLGPVVSRCGAWITGAGTAASTAGSMANGTAVAMGAESIFGTGRRARSLEPGSSIGLFKRVTGRVWVNSEVWTRLCHLRAAVVPAVPPQLPALPPQHRPLRLVLAHRRVEVNHLPLLGEKELPALGRLVAAHHALRDEAERDRLGALLLLLTLLHPPLHFPYLPLARLHLLLLHRDQKVSSLLLSALHDALRYTLLQFQHFLVFTARIFAQLVSLKVTATLT